jgi:hypothetical protein
MMKFSKPMGQMREIMRKMMMAQTMETEAPNCIFILAVQVQT